MSTSQVPASACSNDAHPSYKIAIAICLSLVAGGCVAWILEGKVAHSFPGTIAARTSFITASRGARIDGVLIKLGQSVVPGDALFQLADGQLEDRLAAKRREIAELEADVERSKAACEVELVWRRRELQTGIFETQLKIAALSQEKLNKQVEQIAWKEYLTSPESSAPSATDRNNPFRSISLEIHSPDERRLQAMLREDAAAAATEALATQIALCEERLKKLEATDKEIEAKVKASSGIVLAETRLNSAKEQLATLEGQAKELSVASPTYGTIGEVTLQSGDQITQGEKLVEILDDQQPHIVASFPSSTVAQLRQGSKVTIQFPSDQKRIGVIASIPPQTMKVDGLPESILSVKIEPAGKLWPKMPIGSNVKIVLQ